MKGEIPAELSVLEDLKELLLGDNNLVGELSQEHEFRTCENFEELALANSDMSFIDDHWKEPLTIPNIS